MLITIILSGLVPSVVFAALLGLHQRTRVRLGDERGVALQTVIVIVVLLAIAGAIAGVLLTRGGEAVAEAEQQDILVDAADITNEGLCESYGFSWAGGNCYRTVPVAKPASDFTTQSDCEAAAHLGEDLGYTWNADPDGDPLTDDARCEA